MVLGVKVEWTGTYFSEIFKMTKKISILLPLMTIPFFFFFNFVLSFYSKTITLLDLIFEGNGKCFNSYKAIKNFSVK